MAVCLAGWCTGAGGPRLRHLALPPAAAAAGDYAASPVLVPGQSPLPAQSSHIPALLQPISAAPAAPAAGRRTPRGAAGHAHHQQQPPPPGFPGVMDCHGNSCPQQPSPGVTRVPPSFAAQQQQQPMMMPHNYPVCYRIKSHSLTHSLLGVCQ